MASDPRRRKPVLTGPAAYDPRREAAAEEALAAQRGRATPPPAPKAGMYAAALIKPLIGEAGLTLAELRRRWAEIVGEKFAQLTEPEKLTHGKDGATLTVRAAGAAAPFVQHQSPLIQERCRLAGGAITEIIIRQGPIARPKAGNLRPLQRPLSAAEERALHAALASVEDPGLKRALVRLSRAVAARGDD